MLLEMLLTCVSGISLLILVLILSLVFIGTENFLFRAKETDVSVLDSFGRFLRGRCADKCPPPFLYASCLCLLIIFLFIPMGSIPQFLETGGDIVVIIFLLLAAQGFYIRGMKNFSGDMYQSLDTRELYLLSRFAVVLMWLGGTLSWYVVNRGMPGNIFSLNTFTAMSLWSVAGYWGLLGSLIFLLLLAVTSPSRTRNKTLLVDNVPLPEIFDAIRSTICPAIIVSMFCPFRLGLKLGMTGLSMYTLDFILFWCYVSVAQILFIPFIQKIYGSAKEQLPEFIRIEVVMALLGTAFFLLDLYV